MADKLLKKKARKVAPKKASAEAQKRVVLVGTYKGDQLTAWPGWYNYPISAKDKIDVESAKKVNELWLFKGTRDQKTYAPFAVSAAPAETEHSIKTYAEWVAHFASQKVSISMMEAA